MNVSTATEGFGWTVIGGNGNGLLNVINSNYNEAWGDPGTLYFNAEDGNQCLDLTGTGNQGRNGIQQTVATIQGTLYLLTFWIGHADDHYATSYSGPTTVDLQINGQDIGQYVNSADTLNRINWAQESYIFSATSSSTTVSFFSVNTNNFAGLDNAAISAVPEPGTLGMLVGALVFGALAIRKIRQ